MNGFGAWWLRTSFGTVIGGTAGLALGCGLAWIIATANLIARDNLIAYAGIGVACAVIGISADGIAVIVLARRTQRARH